jgi:hypothetical protein
MVLPGVAAQPSSRSFFFLVRTGESREEPQTDWPGDVTPINQWNIRSPERRKSRGAFRGR